MGISLDAATKAATITLSGPAANWFAVGLDAKLMFDKPYTIVVNATGPFKQLSAAACWLAPASSPLPIAHTPRLLCPAGVSERQLGTCGTEADHCAGTVIASSLKIVSNTLNNGVRTVVLTRPFAGATKAHYT